MTKKRAIPTVEQIKEIRRLYEQEGLGYRAIAGRVGLSRGTVAGIIKKYRFVKKEEK